MRKISYLSLFFIIILSIVFVNLGKFFDITEMPKKMDIIVCLGGGGSERIKKSLELYLSGYSKSGKIVLTGIGLKQEEKKDYRTLYLVKNGVSMENIIFFKGTSNTMKEISVLKNYLLDNNMEGAILVTDPPHSRRIIFLANAIAKYKHDGLSCFVVGSDVAWWNKKDYYKHNKAIRFVMSEMLKLPYNYIAYGILKPLGLYDIVKEEIGDILRYLKYKIQWILG